MGLHMQNVTANEVVLGNRNLDEMRKRIVETASTIHGLLRLTKVNDLVQIKTGEFLWEFIPQENKLPRLRCIWIPGSDFFYDSKGSIDFKPSFWSTQDMYEIMDEFVGKTRARFPEINRGLEKLVRASQKVL